jgi:colanic acid/amylovoran biosynthesis protein
MKVLILNTHSVLNSGDAGVVLAQARFLQRIFPGVRISIVSRTPRLDESFYAPFKISVLPYLFPVPSLYSSRHEKIWHVVKGGLSISAQARLIREIRKSDLIVCSGGGYFYTRRRLWPGPMFFQNFLPVKIAAASRKTIVFFPQSFGPLFSPSAGRWLKGLLESETVVRIYARESASRAFLGNLLSQPAAQKMDLCPDMAFLLKNEGGSSPMAWVGDRPRPVLVVTARHWDFPMTKRRQEKRGRQRSYLSVLEETCLEFYRRWRGSVVIVPQARGPGFFEDDRIPSRHIWERLKKHIPETHLAWIDLPPVVSPFRLMEILSQADLILATRFHSAIFGMVSGIPVISLAYQAKSASTMEWLELDEWSIPITEIDAENIVRLADRILRNKAEIHVSILRQIARAQETIEARLGLFLESLPGSRET